jgi:hypothetical protein
MALENLTAANWLGRISRLPTGSPRSERTDDASKQSRSDARDGCCRESKGDCNEFLPAAHGFDQSSFNLDDVSQRLKVSGGDKWLIGFGRQSSTTRFEARALLDGPSAELPADVLAPE